MNVDFSHVDERHGKIHYRLEEWARWVYVGRDRPKPPPMFIQYRSHAWQWEMPKLSIPVDTIKAHEVEKAGPVPAGRLFHMDRPSR